MASVEVRMDKLKVQANIAVGSRGNPTVTNTLRNMAEVCPAYILSAHLSFVWTDRHEA